MTREGKIRIAIPRENGGDYSHRTIVIHFNQP